LRRYRSAFSERLRFNVVSIDDPYAVALLVI
jgi:hypothetical protein